MGDLQHYFLRRAETAAARNDSERASARLELAKIKERLAEINSQHEPLNSWSEGDPAVRANLYAAAFYVVVGRHPSALRED